MPYGYGSNMDGPANWAAQQQAQQSDNFNQIIRLFLSLKQAQTEEGWKQKELGANQQRYDNTLAQQGVANKQWDARFGLDKSNIENDNTRLAGEAKDRAQNYLLQSKDREEAIKSREEMARMARESAAQTKADAAKRERDRLTASRQIGLINARARRIEGDKTKLSQQIRQKQGDATLKYDPAKMGEAISPLQEKFDALDAESKRLEKAYGYLVDPATGGILPEDMEKELRGENEPIQKDTGILGQFANLLGLGAEQAKKQGQATASPLQGVDPAFIVEGKKNKLSDQQIAAKWQEYQAKYGRK